MTSMDAQDLAPFILGTAQLGLGYGLGEAQFLMSEEKAHSILQSAADAGIGWLDTARAYGQAESRLGRWMSSYGGSRLGVMTKFPSLAHRQDDDAVALLDRSLQESKFHLALPRIDVYFSHHGVDLLRPAIEAYIQGAVADGHICAFGASVYETTEGMELLRIEHIAALQVPVNIVSRGFIASGVLDRAAQRGVKVIARSVFLQGALLLRVDQLPPHLGGLTRVINGLDELSRDTGLSRAALLIAAVRQTPGISALVLGTDSREQLNDLIVAADCPPLPTELRDAIFALGDGLPPTVTDPRRWPKP